VAIFTEKGNVPADIAMAHGTGVSSKDTTLGFRWQVTGVPELKGRFAWVQERLRKELETAVSDLMGDIVSDAKSRAPRWSGRAFRHSTKERWRANAEHQKIARGIDWKFYKNDETGIVARAWSGHFLSRMYEKGFSGKVWQEYIRTRLGKAAKESAKRRYGTRSLAKFFKSKGKELAGKPYAGESARNYSLRQAAYLRKTYGYLPSLYARSGQKAAFRGTGAAVSAGRQHHVTRRPHFSVAARAVLGRAEARLQEAVNRAMNG
jgi:hypothetical protein